MSSVEPGLGGGGWGPSPSPSKRRPPRAGGFGGGLPKPKPKPKKKPGLGGGSWTPAAPRRGSPPAGAVPGGAAPIGTGAPSAPSTPQDVESYITEHYPQFSWLTQNPEMMDLFRRAQAEDYSPTKFMLEMQKTSWWKTTSESTRSWEALKAVDPAQAAQVLRQQRGSISDQAIRLGVDLNPETLGVLAENALRFGWTPGELGDALVNYASWDNPSGGGLVAGALQQVKKMRGDYGVPMSDEETKNWARRLLTEEATPETMRAYFVEQAKSMFPSLERALDAGLTVRQYADPYFQLAAQELEITAESIDLNDTKWSRPLMQVDKDGNRVQMSLYDWSKTIRSDPVYGWSKTKQAQDRADALALGLARTFGQVA